MISGVFTSAMMEQRFEHSAPPDSTGTTRGSFALTRLPTDCSKKLERHIKNKLFYLSVKRSSFLVKSVNWLQNEAKCGPLEPKKKEEEVDEALKVRKAA